MIPRPSQQPAVWIRRAQITMTDQELADELTRIAEDLDSIRFKLKIVRMHLGQRQSGTEQAAGAPAADAVEPGSMGPCGRKMTRSHLG